MPRYEIRGQSTLSFTFEIEAENDEAAESVAKQYLEDNGSSSTDILGEDDFEINDVLVLAEG